MDDCLKAMTDKSIAEIDHEIVNGLTLTLHDLARQPRRFRVKVDKHPAGSDSPWQYGCYFPLTDLVVGDMGGRGTGKPQDVEWID